jgi:hypothetical protein
MQEKKVDKNTFAEKSEDVWSAMQEVRTYMQPGRHEIATFLVSQDPKNTRTFAVILPS